MYNSTSRLQDITPLASARLCCVPFVWYVSVITSHILTSERLWKFATRQILRTLCIEKILYTKTLIKIIILREFVAKVCIELGVVC